LALNASAMRSAMTKFSCPITLMVYLVRSLSSSASRRLMAVTVRVRDTGFFLPAPARFAFPPREAPPSSALPRRDNTSAAADFSRLRRSLPGQAHTRTGIVC